MLEDFNMVKPKTSFLVSLLIHSLLLLIFSIIKINWKLTVPEYIEIHFARAVDIESYKSYSKTKPEDLNLPLRRIFEYEKEKINIADRSKLIPEEKIDVLNYEENKKLAPKLHDGAKSDEKEAPYFSLGKKLSPNLISKLKSTNESPYKIEGEAADRTIIMKVIPQYPSNIHQEATVKIRFTVLPNGLIGEMIPIIKSHPLMEKITLEAFKQWRFNALPPQVPQIPEQGTITFKYLLK